MQPTACPDAVEGAQAAGKKERGTSAKGAKEMIEKFSRRSESNRTRNGTLLSFQRDIPNSDVRAQFVFTFAMILQRLAEPAAGFAVAIAVHVADSSARVHHAISRVLIANGNANVAHA